MTTELQPAGEKVKARWPALLRVGLFWCGYLAILFAVAFVKAKVPPQWGQLFWGFVSSLFIVALTLAFLRWEGQRAGQVGLKPDAASGLRFGLGVLIACATYGVIVALVSGLLGPMRFVRAGGLGPFSMGLTVCTTIVLACMEELGFRGYPLRTLVPAIGYWPAQTVVAVAFGLCHRWAFHYSWAAVLLGVIPCAFLFGAAAIASRGLAMPIGLHAGLNLAQWSVGERGVRGGVWATIVDPAASARIDTLSPIIVVMVTALITAILWAWQRQHRAGGR